jgi:hypothetical protein
VLAETIYRYRIVADLHDLSEDERKRDADALVDYLGLDPTAEAARFARRWRATATT